MNIKLTFASFVLALLQSVSIRAVPAYPYQIHVKTQEGKDVVIYLHGDENLKYAVSTDGYTLLNDNDIWWYAKEENDRVVKSSHRLMDIDDETQELKQFKEICRKGLVPDRVSDNHLLPNKALRAHAVTNLKPVVGERRALVILMQFKNLAFHKTISDFSALFNALDYHENNATGSVRDFYRFASQGQLDYISDIYGPYTANYNMNYYGGNTATGGNDANAAELCIEAMRNLPDTIDFSKYDNDNDGLIDNVHIIFAGYGEEAGASSSAIWSHEYPHILTIANGIRLAGYSCSPELRGNSGYNLSRIGVICHELGHSLGAMDYYDTNYAVGGEYVGTGKWDIMASGSWNDDGKTPPNFNPYVRTTVFGWNTQEVLTPNQQIVMPQMGMDNIEQTKVYRLETDSPNDYFLLENRQQHGFDAALPGAGLMIYHVHPDIETHRLTNTINATHPQCLYPVCSSYSEPNKKKYGDINTAMCPFPGSNNVKTFSVDSNPSATAWDGSPSNVSLHNIMVYNSNGTITFTTDENGIVVPDDSIEKNVIHKESFETAWDNRHTITSLWGNKTWETYRKGNLVVGADYIPEPTDGKSILMLYSGKSNVISETEAIGENIAVENNRNYVLTIDVYITANANLPTPHFCIYIIDGNGEKVVYSTSETTQGWKHVEIPLTIAGNEFRYKLYGEICSGGIFLDNIILYENEDASSVELLEASTNSNSMSVYSLNGIYIGNYGTSHSSLNKGLYIIYDNKRIRKMFINK